MNSVWVVLKILYLLFEISPNLIRYFLYENTATNEFFSPETPWPVRTLTYNSKTYDIDLKRITTQVDILYYKDRWCYTRIYCRLPREKSGLKTCTLSSDIWKKKRIIHFYRKKLFLLTEWNILYTFRYLAILVLDYNVLSSHQNTMNSLPLQLKFFYLHLPFVCRCNNVIKLPFEYLPEIFSRSELLTSSAFQ